MRFICKLDRGRFDTVEFYSCPSTNFYMPLSKEGILNILSTDGARKERIRAHECLAALDIPSWALTLVAAG